MQRPCGASRSSPRVDAWEVGIAGRHVLDRCGTVGRQDCAPKPGLRGREPPIAAHDGSEVPGHEIGVRRLAEIETYGAVVLLPSISVMEVKPRGQFIAPCDFQGVLVDHEHPGSEFEPPDPDEEAKSLAEGGLNVLPRMAGAGGRDVHPNSTHGVLIRVYPVNSFSVGTSPSASGLSGIMRVIVAVRDLEHARRVYHTGFGLACDPERDDDVRGVRGFICRPPDDGVIEFVTPTNADRPFAREVAGFLDDREGLYALVLHADEARESVTVCGARIVVEPAPRS